MWLLYQLDKTSAAYNFPHIQRLRGTLHVAQLCGALKAAAGRHEVLRMRYGCDEQGVPFQSPTGADEWEVPVREVSVGCDEEAMAEVEAEVGRPFELEVSSVRLVVVHVGAEEHIVIINMHHIATDWWSTPYWLGDMVGAYNALVGGKAVVLGKESALRYADYAQWQRETLADSERMEPHMEYWREMLSGDLPVLELPTDRPRPAVLTSRGGCVDVHVDAVVAGKLWELCKGCGTTMMRGALGAWGVALGKWSGQDEVIVGIPYAARDHPATHDVVGYFVKSVAIRLSVGGLQSFRETVASTDSAVGTALSHAVVPFVKVVEEVAPARDSSRLPVFQVLFAWEEQGGANQISFKNGWGNCAGTLHLLEALPIPSLVSLADRPQHAKFEVQLTLGNTDEQGNMCGDLAFNRDLFERETVEHMAAHFADILESMVNAPDVPLARLKLSLLQPSEGKPSDERSMPMVISDAVSLPAQLLGLGNGVCIADDRWAHYAKF